MPKYSTGNAKPRHGNTKQLAPLTDLRQAAFYKAYFDPQSPHYSNALQSALQAGYTQEYAESITTLMPKWLSERMATETLISKAERNIQQILDYSDNSDAKIRTKADISKFTLERRAREKWGKDEAPRTQNNVFIMLKDEQKKLIAQRVIEQQKSRNPKA